MITVLVNEEQIEFADATSFAIEESGLGQTPMLVLNASDRNRVALFLKWEGVWIEEQD